MNSWCRAPGRLQGSARVIRCLQDHQSEVAPECAAELFNHEIKLAGTAGARVLQAMGTAPCRCMVWLASCRQRQTATHNCSLIACCCARCACYACCAEDIDFKYPLKQACIVEIDMFCKKVEPGHARIIRQELILVVSTETFQFPGAC